MKYATWKLDFTDPNYGTGPEETIAAFGFSAEGAWVDGQVEEGATILGYVTGDLDVAGLKNWNFVYLTQAEALDFCKAIDAKAYILEDGRITVPFSPADTLDTPTE